MTPAEPTSSHLDESAIAAFLDRRLDDGERRRLEAHLVECAACRDELADAARVVATLPRTRGWVAWAGLAAAAALALLLARPAVREPAEAVLRGPATDAGQRSAVVLIQPEAAAAVAAHELRFAWHAVGTDASYRLVVTNGRGDTVWTASGADTAVSATAARLGVGDYFWYVDALTADGRSVASAVRDLRIAP